MGLFEKLFGKGQTSDTVKQSAEAKVVGTESSSAHKNSTRPSSGDMIETMLTMANMAAESGDYTHAVDGYKNILKLEPNTTAQYNLGSLYAQGKGVGQDYMEGAYWFHQAERNGDVQAGKLCLKCTLDYVHQDFDMITPEQLYDDMVRFVRHVCPESTDVNLEADRKLYAIAGNHFNKKEYAAAAKLFRAAAEFGNDGYSQNYLAVLYNAGAGLEQNDLASLYWFDKAVDNGAADLAQKDRDGILNAYRTNLSPQEFYEQMMILSGWCSTGSPDVPKDADKAARWRKIAEAGTGETLKTNR